MKAGGTTGQLQQDRGNPRLKFLDRYAGIPVIEALGPPAGSRGRRPVPTDWRTIGLVKTVGHRRHRAAERRHPRHPRGPARRPHRAVRQREQRRVRPAARRASTRVVTVPVRDIVQAVRTGPGRAVRRRRGLRRVAALREPAHRVVRRAGARSACARRASTGTSRTTSSSTTTPVTRSTTTGASSPRWACRLDERPVVPARRRRRVRSTAPYVVLHLWPGGANFAERSWPVDRWHAVARALNERGFDVVLTGGPGDVAADRGAGRRAGRRTGIRAHTVAGAVARGDGRLAPPRGGAGQREHRGHAPRRRARGAGRRAQRADVGPPLGPARCALPLRRVADGARRLPEPGVGARRPLPGLHGGDHGRSRVSAWDDLMAEVADTPTALRRRG